MYIVTLIAGKEKLYKWADSAMKKSKTDSPVRRVTGKGVFPYQYAFTLLIPLRNIFLSPKTLIKRLSLTPTSKVLEIGPGPGYFSAKIARSICNGKLYLYDIQKEMIDYARKRLSKRGIGNVQYSVADGCAFPFNDRMFDRIVMVTVFGEVDNKELYLKEIYRTLNDTGIVSVSETAGDPDRLTDREIIDLFKDHGFFLTQRYSGFGNVTLNFKKNTRRLYS